MPAGLRLEGVRELVLIFSQPVLAEVLGIDEQGVFELCAGPRIRSLPILLSQRAAYLRGLVELLRAKGFPDARIGSWFFAPAPYLKGRAPDQVLRDEWTPNDTPAMRVRQHALDS